MAYGTHYIEEWRAAGKLTPESILDRLFSEASQTTYSRFSTPNQHQLLKERFQSSASTVDGVQQITRSAFVSLLQGSNELPTTQTGQQAGNIIFDSLRYLSRYPFNIGHCLSSHDALTWEELNRALAWLLSVEADFLNAGTVGDEVWSRTRTPSDHRRLLFQSLATSLDGKGLPYDFEEARRLSFRNAQEVSESNVCFIAPNNDEDGDEIFHDLLQVAVCTQPHYTEWLTPASKASFLPVAHELHDRQDSHLHHLSIPRGRFKALVKILLQCQFEPKSRRDAELVGKFPEEELDRSAESVVNAFCHSPQVGITWRMFDDTLRHLITPGSNQAYLIDPLLRIIPRTLFDRALCEYDPETLVPECGSSHILNPAVMAQLHTVLLMTARFDFLRCVSCSSPSASPYSTVPDNSDISSFAHMLRAGREDNVILAVFGSSRMFGDNSVEHSSTKYVFAVHLLYLTESGQTVQPSDRDDVERTLMLQVAPVHDVFRSIIGKPAWSIGSDGICFGTKGRGASMELSQGLRRCTFTHVATDDSDQSYEATKWRGDWAIEFDIEQLEIWKDIEP